jgi:hypothetical protein
MRKSMEARPTSTGVKYLNKWINFKERKNARTELHEAQQHRK